MVNVEALRHVALMVADRIEAGQEVRFQMDAPKTTPLQLLVQVEGEAGLRLIPLDGSAVPFSCVALWLVVGVEGEKAPRLLQVTVTD